MMVDSQVEEDEEKKAAAAAKATRGRHEPITDGHVDFVTDNGQQPEGKGTQIVLLAW